ncbi:MAG: arsenate reductase (glutaredoxin) [Mesorhizobium sp.]
MSVTIYHNPRCGTSRNALAIIRAAGIEPQIVEYLDARLSHQALASLFASTGQPVRDLLRRKDTPYHELGLDDPKWTDEELIGFVTEHPVLMNRPIVVTDRGAALCRPSERVAALLPPGSLPATFVKEDGETVRFQELVQ